MRGLRLRLPMFAVGNVEDLPSLQRAECLQRCIPQRVRRHVRETLQRPLAALQRGPVDVLALADALAKGQARDAREPSGCGGGAEALGSQALEVGDAGALGTVGTWSRSIHAERALIPVLGAVAEDLRDRGVLQQPHQFMGDPSIWPCPRQLNEHHIVASHLHQQRGPRPVVALGADAHGAGSLAGLLAAEGCQQPRPAILVRWHDLDGRTLWEGLGQGHGRCGKLCSSSLQKNLHRRRCRSCPARFLALLGPRLVMPRLCTDAIREAASHFGDPTRTSLVEDAPAPT
mmetsp:Transcript_59561/g.153925  ORF Transcript_59561/g.153925 Transcript_59561/m.153925 type:complete len:288 (+) Transcript_59561:651-1514(+)